MQNKKVKKAKKLWRKKSLAYLLSQISRTCNDLESMAVAKWYDRCTKEKYPEPDSHVHINLTEDRRTTLKQWGEDGLFNKWSWESWLSM